MKRILTFSILGAVLMAAPAAAQTPDSALAVSKNGQSLFRVNIDAGAIWGGTFDGDNNGSGIPGEGAGTRMMWYPRKAAFRAGYINGTQWDAANIGFYSVAMGQSVRASGDNAVAFGVRSTAANGSSFAVGEDNTASGYGSVAMGYHAHTNARRGSFVFGDNVTGGTGDSIRAELVGQAVWRLSCGMRIYTNQALTTGVAFGGPSVNSSVCGSNYYYGQSNAMISTSTGAYLSNAGFWVDVSDVNRKHLFADVLGEDVLGRLRAMPIRTWTYRLEPDHVRHLGPTAQDFHAAFGLGSDSTTIAGIDEAGVALAAAQALEARTAAQQQRIDALEAQNAALQARVATLEAQARESAALLARIERLERERP
jgi:hypothetical protein